MTSQGHDQDDLIRRMRVADEPPLKKGAMNRMSSEEEFPHAAGKSSEHSTQLLLMNVKYPTTPEGKN